MAAHEDGARGGDAGGHEAADTEAAQECVINELQSGSPISTAELVARFTRLIVNGMRGAGRQLT